jgi:signal transduction histidine kinase
MIGHRRAIDVFSHPQDKPDRPHSIWHLKPLGAMVLAAFVLNAVSGAESAGADDVDLSGEWRFRVGDAPVWSRPEIDDSSWSRVPVPRNWDDLGLPTTTVHGWYRYRLSVADGSQWHDPALLLGMISDIDEVFLNGVRVGGSGTFGWRWVVPPRRLRLYRVPAGLLQTGSDNVLAIHVQRAYFEGGISEGPLRLGEFSRLSAMIQRRETRGLQAETALLVFLGAGGVFALMPVISGLGDRRSLTLALGLILYFLAILSESRLLFDSGWKGHWFERLNSLIAVIQPLVGLVFVLQVCERTMPKSYWRVILSAAVLLIVDVLLGTPELILVSWPLYLLYVFALCPLCVVWCLLAVIARKPGAVPIGVGISTAATLQLYEFVTLSSASWWLDVAVGYYGVVVFSLCGGLAVVMHYRHLRWRLRQSTSALLSAQEEERKRVARDIHDGVGQSLLAVKLGLQMAEASLKRGADTAQQPIHDLVLETSRAIEELREVAQALRPAALEHMGLDAAIRQHAERVAQRAGLTIQVDTHPLPPIPETVKDHLFRIFQEALKNVVTHADAKQVDVRLVTEGSRLLLQIHDDGRGFSSHARTPRHRGLGLETIIERAELLGGQASISSQVGRGTSVQVDVPIG